MIPRGERAKRTSPIRLLLVLLVAAGGALFELVVADDAVGRPFALAMFATLLAVSLGAALLISNLARRFGASLRVHRVMAALLVAVALLGPLLLVVALPRVTGHALASIPARHPGVPGWLAELAARAGAGLGEPPAPRESAPTVHAEVAPSSATAPVAPSRREATDAGSPAPSEDPPTELPADRARFSAGDTTYEEPGTACDSLGDVSDIAAAYRPEAARATVEALAKRRYPAGLPFLQAQDDQMLGTWLKGAPTTFEGVASRFEAAVHEGSHVWGAKRFAGGNVSYSVRPGLTIETRRLQNFDRSEVMALLPEGASDTYASTYLAGRSGAQGFNTLLDELNAYAHSLASRFCTRDLLAPGTRVSARDGVLAMMLYVELYLGIAREKHAADYAAIVKDAGHRRLIVTDWNRAEYWLRKSMSFPALGIHDGQLEAWVYAPPRLAEITRIREAR
jgi:hypothetical protein